jgi:hypothetical protein
MNARMLAIVAALSTACGGSMTQVLQEKQDNKAKTRTYAVAPDKAWEIAETVLRWDGAGVIEEHRDKSYLLTAIAGYSNAADETTFVGAWIEPAGDAVKVTCAASGPHTITRFPEDDYERVFHNRFQQALAYVNAGQPIPIQPPRPR